jgi:hypothetical protein
MRVRSQGCLEKETPGMETTCYFPDWFYTGHWSEHLWLDFDNRPHTMTTQPSQKDGSAHKLEHY